MVKRDAAVFIQYRHDALGETAFADRDIGAALAFEPERIDGFAADAFHRGDRIAAHALVRLRVYLLEMGIARSHAHRLDAGGEFLGADGLGIAHHLGTAGDDAIFHARHDLRCGKAHGGDAATAETIESHAARPDIEAGIERRHAAEITALLALLGRGRPDDVIDRRGIEIVAVLQRLENGGGKMLRVEMRQRPLPRLANAARRTDGIDDIGFGHRSTPQ
jgi:hypothetical protein